MSTILVIGALPESLVNFRGDLIRSLVQSGHQVTAMAAPADEELVSQVESLGAEFQSFPVHRNGLNPLGDIQTLLSLFNIFRKKKPDVILAYTVKPVVWGGIAAIVTPRAYFVALIEGLGFAFQQGGIGRKLLTLIVQTLYSISLKRAQRIVFLNPDNESALIDSGIVEPGKTVRINGIGVNLEQFGCKQIPSVRPTTFLLIARLLGDKGIREYVQAARKVKKRYPDAVFHLLGPEDPSPDGLSLSEVQNWHDEGVIRYWGEAIDVRPYLSQCHVYVLPSYHEGMPRTVMEAMATGRPILTTDAPGCRETVIHGKNGFLAPVRDVEALVERMIWFIEHPEEWEVMGAQSRRIAEEKFDVRKINRELMRIMGV